MLNERGQVEVKVFYTLGESGAGNMFDDGFGKAFAWDIPLLDGYQYAFLKNTAKRPGPYYFNGIVNPDIISAITAYHPDALLVTGWSFKSHLEVLRYFKNKIPVLFRGDSTILDEQPGLKKRLRKLFLQWVYRHIDMALYVGKNSYDYFVQFGLTKEQLVWAPHAIDNERFGREKKENQLKAAQIREQLQIKATAFVFLFAGKFEAKKDPGLLLDAFAGCAFPASVHLLFVGNGILQSGMKLKAKDNRNMHFMDFQNQSLMPAVYRVGDVFVLPSRGPGETWGLAVNEAMACERPVIVSDKCGCAADLIADDVNGYVFEAGNINDLKQKMQQVYVNRRRLPEMGAASGNKIKEYSFQAICAAIERAIMKP